MPSLQVVAHHAEVIEGDVREVRASGAIAERPDVCRSSLQAFVNFDVAVRTQLDSGDIEADGLSVWHAADCDQKIGRFDDALAARVFHVNANLLAGAPFDALGFGFEQHFDSFVAEEFQERGSHVRVLLVR